MLFLPYKMDAKVNGLPFFTILICLLCVFVYAKQYARDKQHSSAAYEFCHQELDKNAIALMRNFAQTEIGNPCYLVMESIRAAEYPPAEIQSLVDKATLYGLFESEQAESRYLHQRLTDLYTRYNLLVPRDLTSDLAYDPGDLNLLKMISSTFSHGDIIHLLGNLLFFYIFAASVELVIGSLVYIVFIGVTTVGTSLAYSYAMAGVEGALPTIGLSGVVMATVAALGVMLPYAKIRCFFWFFVYFKTFTLPALLLAAWYIGWDVYAMNSAGSVSYINYTAHVSGAAIGLLMGLYYFLFHKTIIHKTAGNY